MEQPTLTEQKCLPSSSYKGSRKTYYREVASILLLSLLYFGFVGQNETLEVVTWPFITFGIAAFGLKSDTIQEAINAKVKR